MVIFRISMNFRFYLICFFFLLLLFQASEANVSSKSENETEEEYKEITEEEKGIEFCFFSSDLLEKTLVL